MRRALVWERAEGLGTEFADVTVGDGELSARGVAIGTRPLPYRLEYELATAEGFVTTSLRVGAQGAGWRRALVLGRAAGGTWTVMAEADGEVGLDPPGGDAAPLFGALDCDLGLSPLTNTMPVLRHRLLDGGGPVDLLMAWVAVPDLTVVPSAQRYTSRRPATGHRADAGQGPVSVVAFESGGFRADLEFDRDGLVRDYPGLARRVAEG
jgi:uncharacterized protein